MRKIITPQGWFILIMMLLCSFAGEAQSTIQIKPKAKLCTEIKADGMPCKAYAKQGQTKCRFHTENKILCGSNTSKNTPCKIPVAKQGDKCWRHKQ